MGGFIGEISSGGDDIIDVEEDITVTFRLRYKCLVSKESIN